MAADLVDAARALGSRRPPPRGKVVVALPEAPLSHWVKRTLEVEYDVATARDAGELSAMCRDDPPVAVLASLALPKLDPLHLLRSLRSAARTSRVHVFFTSRLVQRNTMVVVSNAGAADFLFQPFGATELLDRLRARIDAPPPDASTGRRRKGERARTALRLAWETSELHKAALESATQKEEALTLAMSVLSSTPLGFCLMDTNLRAIRFNASFARLAGIDERRFGDPAGAPLSRLLPADVAQQLDHAAGLALSRSRTLDELTLTLVGPDGDARHVIASCYPVRSGSQVLGLGIFLLDATDRVQTEIALRASNGKILELLRIKDRFLAAISHELRTPLAAVEMWTHALLQPDVTATTAERAAQAIRQSARSQSRLIEDLLDLSRAVTGHFTVVREPIDLREVLEDVLASIRPHLAAKGIALERSLLRDAPPIAGDARRLEQVFHNILANAIAFTPPGGTIRVKLERRHGAASRSDDERLVVSIRDTGPGIDPALLVNLFEPFQRERQAGRGLGLGLPITHHIVRAHHGEIAAVSELGRGACFQISLPLAEQRALPSAEALPRSTLLSH